MSYNAGQIILRIEAGILSDAMERPVGLFLEYHPTYLDHLKYHDPEAYATTKVRDSKHCHYLLFSIELWLIKFNCRNSSPSWTMYNMRLYTKLRMMLAGSLVRRTLYERVKQLNMLPVSTLLQVDIVLADDGDDS